MTVGDEVILGEVDVGVDKSVPDCVGCKVLPGFVGEIDPSGATVSVRVPDCVLF